MKKIKQFLLPAFILVCLSSCTSVRVITDYDREINFKDYRTYAFYKTGIDKAQISDLDKKRILRAIDTEMVNRGFIKSQKPDILISIFTKEREQVDIFNTNFGWGLGGFGVGGFGWGWNSWLWGAGWRSTVSARTEGSLYIDLINAENKQLVWQGHGVGTLSNIKKIDKKEKRIRKFVSEILAQYPPMQLTSN